MGNCFNYCCPVCGSPDGIEVDAIVTLRLTSTGTEGDASKCGPGNWNGESAASCSACRYIGTVREFEAAGIVGGISRK